MTASGNAPRRTAVATPARPVRALQNVVDVVRANDATPERILSALSLLVGLRVELDALERALIELARDQRASWAQISSALGLASRQAAEQRWLRLCDAVARDPVKVRASRRRQQNVDSLYGAAIGELRRAVVAVHRELTGDAAWDERHPRAALARMSLEVAVTAEPGAMYQLAQHAMDDLEAMAAAGEPISGVVFRNLRQAVARAARAETS